MSYTQNFCENCGAALAADSRFCERCGTPVPVEPPVAPSTPASPAPTGQPDPPAAAQRFHWSTILLPALFLVLLVAVGAAFWIFAPSPSGPTAVPAHPADLTEPAEATVETTDVLPPMTSEVPVAPAPIPEAVPAAAPESFIEDWFASQPWFQELSASMPEGVTLQLFARPDDELPGATTVEIRENRSPDSGFDTDFSPLVGIFRVAADRSRVLYFDVLESDYVPLEHFLASRRSPGPVGQVPDLPVTATPEETSAALPPVEIVYRRFMEDAFRSRGGNLRAGSPEAGADRIEVELGFDGQTIVYVFVEIANDGQSAEVLTGPAEPQGLPGEGHTARVLVGPKDAGADRTYTLRLTREGWVITGFTEGEH